MREDAMTSEPVGPSPGHRVQSLSELEADALDRIGRIGSCSMATIDRRGRTRVRMVNIIWEGTTGYLLTWYRSLKAKHLQANPVASLCYWDPQHQQVYADCRAEFVEDAAEKRRIYELCKATPEPVGYDPAPYYANGADDDDYALVKLTPWRLELFEIANLEDGGNRVWSVGD